MEKHRRQSHLLWGFLILSLLLHLVLIYLLPQHSLIPDYVPREPVYVEVRPPSPSPKPLERELDLPPQPEPEQPRKTPAKRLGPADQVIVRETAPQGDAPEDRRPPKPRPEPQPQQQPKAKPQPTPSPVVRHPEPAKVAPEGQSPPPPTATPAPQSKPLPDLRTLTRLAPQTLARLEDEWRTKYRADVEKGDAVWLDTEKDILISFFQRFRTQVYNVWNYPARSVERQEEGTCLVKITVNRAGEVVRVQLLESSGYATLDEEALDAVQKASPFGRLPRAYQKDELNIFAFFKYNLTRRAIF